MLAPVTEMDFGEEGPLRVNMLARERWPGVRRGARGGHRPADRIPRHRRARRGGRSRRRRGAPAPARAARLARPRVRVADAVALPRARAGRCRRASPAASWRRRTAAPIRARRCARSPPRRRSWSSAWRCEAIEHDGSVGHRRAHERGNDRCRPGGRGRRPVERLARAASATGPPVRPVKGQILELRARGAMPSPFERVLRTPRCYLVVARRRPRRARRHGRGAGLRHDGDGRRRLPPARGGVGGAARGGRAGVRGRPGRPAARARPTTSPVVGPDEELEGLIWATGHWRNGVLLAPLTADAVAGLLMGI